MLCPEIAIDAVDRDWGLLLQTMPVNDKLYRQRLDDAAARGEFKWLMDPDAIDLENTQLNHRRAQLRAEKARQSKK
jgi:hypothetical protein